MSVSWLPPTPPTTFSFLPKSVGVFHVENSLIFVSVGKKTLATPNTTENAVVLFTDKASSKYDGVIWRMWGCLCILIHSSPFIN